MPDPVLTEEQYSELNGAFCPFCSSRDFGPVKSKRIKRTTALECHECDGSWLERGHMEGSLFIITGYTPIHKHDIELDKVVN